MLPCKISLRCNEFELLGQRCTASVSEASTIVHVTCTIGEGRWLLLAGGQTGGTEPSDVVVVPLGAAA